jgi:hypothetical protein
MGRKLSAAAHAAGDRAAAAAPAYSEPVPALLPSKALSRASRLALYEFRAQTHQALFRPEDLAARDNAAAREGLEAKRTE